jgi:arylsulfatase A-like enzyme
MKCATEFHNEKWKDMDGADDSCTANELLNWIDQDASKPFFGMMWTFETHYPYAVSGTEKKYNTSDPDFNRYLNAVNHSDAVLGKLMEDLKKNHLLESTLVVIIGDHGEAFGRHGQTTHASGIYEENVHIPCLFINPGFKEERNQNPGGIVDIAPTIMNILELPASPKWQGENLFTADKNKRIYFFSPWSDYLFGYREDDRKYIFNATKNTTEIYDLKTDPYETKNLADQYPSDVEKCHECLAAWTQYSNKFMDTLLNSGRMIHK